MAVTVCAVFVDVRDPDAAPGSCREAPGLESRNDVASGGFGSLTVGPAGRTSTSSRLRRTSVGRRPVAGSSCLS